MYIYNKTGMQPAVGAHHNNARETLEGKREGYDVVALSHRRRGLIFFSACDVHVNNVLRTTSKAKCTLYLI